MKKKRPVLSEIRQRQINTVLSHLYVSSLKKKIKLIDIENRLVVVRGRGEGGEQNGWSRLLRESILNSHHKGKNCNPVQRWMLTRLIVVIISQYIPNHYVLLYNMCVLSHSVMSDSATSWTAPCQAPLFSTTSQSITDTNITLCQL